MIPENIHDCQDVLMHFDCNNCKYKITADKNCKQRMKFQDEAGIIRRTGLTLDGLIKDMIAEEDK